MKYESFPNPGSVMRGGAHGLAAHGTKRLNTAKTLGILGGMGPLATANFYATFVARTGAFEDQGHHRVLILSDPHIPDRTEFLIGGGPSPLPSLLDGARRLQEVGADLIVIPCNTASFFRTDIEQTVEIPVFDWIGSVMDEIGSSGHAPVGILATTGMLHSRLYQDALSNRGIAYLVPQKGSQASLMAAIYGPKGVKTLSRATQSAISLLSESIDALVDAGAKSILLGCSELPVLSRAIDQTSIPSLFDPGESAISGLLEWFRSPDGHLPVVENRMPSTGFSP